MAAKRLALDHFDFHYKPVFKRQWPSVRLGLLCDQKYCALVNNYGSPDAVKQQLERLGTFDFLEYADNRMAVRQAMFGGQFPEQDLQSQATPDNASTSTANEPDGDDRYHFDARDEAGLLTFVKPTLPEDPSDPNSYLPQETRVGSSTTGREDEYWAERLSVVGSTDEVQILDEDLSPEFPPALSAYMFPASDITPFPQASPDLNGVVGYYLMDAASLFPIICLGIADGDTVMDLCAAPGGKSLAMLQTLYPSTLICNDDDLQRMERVKLTMDAYLPTSHSVRQSIILRNADASSIQWGIKDQLCDKVLVDAPCTTDRFSLHNDDDKTNIFRRSRMRERLDLPENQIGILLAGLRILKPGGTLIYSTCSLSPVQNDAVVETAVRRYNRKDAVDDEEEAYPGEKKLKTSLKRQIQTASHAPGSGSGKIVVRKLNGAAGAFRRAGIFRFSINTCRYGQLIVPYAVNNFGPAYVARLEKIEK